MFAEIGEHAWGAKASIGFGRKRENPRPVRLADNEGRPVGKEGEAVREGEAGCHDPHGSGGVDEADRALVDHARSLTSCVAATCPCASICSMTTTRTRWPH